MRPSFIRIFSAIRAIIAPSIVSLTICGNISAGGIDATSTSMNQPQNLRSDIFCEDFNPRFAYGAKPTPYLYDFSEDSSEKPSRQCGVIEELLTSRLGISAESISNDYVVLLVQLQDSVYVRVRPSDYFPFDPSCHDSLEEITKQSTGYDLLATNNGDVLKICKSILKCRNPDEDSLLFSIIQDSTNRKPKTDKALKGFLEDVRESSIRINNDYRLHMIGSEKYANFTADQFIQECREIDLKRLQAELVSMKPDSLNPDYEKAGKMIANHSCNTFYYDFCYTHFPIKDGVRWIRSNGKLIEAKYASLIDEKTRRGKTENLRIRFSIGLEFCNDLDRHFNSEIKDQYRHTHRDSSDKK